jgi:hypothetical protein
MCLCLTKFGHQYPAIDPPLLLGRRPDRDGFRLVTGHVQDELVGFTLGSVLPANTACGAASKAPRSRAGARDWQPNLRHQRATGPADLAPPRLRQGHEPSTAGGSSPSSA